jgi:hypothetical protein
MLRVLSLRCRPETRLAQQCVGSCQQRDYDAMIIILESLMPVLQDPYLNIILVPNQGPYVTGHVDVGLLDD